MLGIWHAPVTLFSWLDYLLHCMKVSKLTSVNLIAVVIIHEILSWSKRAQLSLQVRQLLLASRSIVSFPFDFDEYVMCNIHYTSVRDLSVDLVHVRVFDLVLLLEISFEIFVIEWVLHRILIVWYSLVFLGKLQDLLVSFHANLTLLFIVLVPNFVKNFQNFLLDQRIQFFSLIVIGSIFKIFFFLWRRSMLINLIFETFEKLELFFSVTYLVLTTELTRQIISSVTLVHIYVLQSLILHVYSNNHL